MDLLRNTTVVTDGAECRVCVKCPACGEDHSVAMRLDEWHAGLRAWENGVHIQDAFPRLSPEDREILVSGTCPACWDEIFGAEPGGDLP